MGKPSKILQEYLQSDDYPIIKIPQRIIDILEDVVPIPKPPYKLPLPTTPTLEVIKQPIKPEQGVFSWLLGIDSGHKYRLAEYENSLRQYPTLKKLAQERYEAELQVYRSEVEFYKQYFVYYEKKLLKHQEVVKYIPKNPEDLQTRRKLMNLFLKDAPRPTPWQPNRLLSKGLMESFFKNFLIERYGKQLVTECSTIVGEEYNEAKLPLYAPDFIITSAVSPLVFAIEIDEPYTAITNEAIHFIRCKADDRKERNYSGQYSTEKWMKAYSEFYSVDDKRDAFFTSNGWVVIRFTERQVVESPSSCLDLIDELASYLQLGQLTFIDSAPNKRVKIEKRWTKATAQMFASIKYRQSYLPPQYALILNKAHNPRIKSRGIDEGYILDDDNSLPF